MSARTANWAWPEVGKGTIEPLFEAVARHRPDMEPVVSAEGREGELIASGEGEVRGKRIRGTIRVTFYAAECVLPQVLEGKSVDPGLHICKENPGGLIETDDGAIVEIDGKGFGLRGFDPEEPQRWRLMLGIRFATTDERYRWLNGTLGLWEGLFDEKDGRAHYRVYIPRPGGDGPERRGTKNFPSLRKSVRTLGPRERSAPSGPAERRLVSTE